MTGAEDGRYELQLPFYPLNNSYLTGTVADVCGVSGVNPGGDGTRACNLFQPGQMAAAALPRSQPARAGQLPAHAASSAWKR